MKVGYKRVRGMKYYVVVKGTEVVWPSPFKFVSKPACEEFISYMQDKTINVR